MSAVLSTPPLRCAVVTATAEMVRYIGNNLRERDRLEVEDMGFSGMAGLWRSYKNAVIRKVAMVDGLPAAAWGLHAPAFSRIGHPFLLTTALVERLPVTVLRVGRQEVAEMLTVCDELRGEVSASYGGAIRLLECMGFAIGDPRPFGPRNAMFCHYSIGRA